METYYDVIVSKKKVAFGLSFSNKEDADQLCALLKHFGYTTEVFELVHDSSVLGALSVIADFFDDKALKMEPRQ